ncbi:hypothetical protein H312_00911 [Anncaliia algerae PRA339]|uniref:L-type lectin-like domain-containing protein n=1 Tax=Anncaliia algerae PRA339 TaxID=1288291 RepID=A0A059F3P8_9MICR|nr:hypothetical protein H312_00911 [Anncaliia algerae PRA339]
MFLFLIQILGSEVEETLIHNVGYNGRDINSLVLDGVEIQHNELLFHNKDNKKSHLRIKNTIPEQNWSAEIDMSVPKLDYPSQSGLYFWYTKKEIEGETINKEDFHGFVAGIEFVGNTTEVIVAIHENKEHPKVVKDFLDPNLLKDQNKITFKVIHTLNNIKIEIYSNGFLIYDHLRLLDNEYFGEHDENGHVSIIYASSQTQRSDGIKISGIRINKRVENDNYDILKEVNLPKESNTEKDKLEVGMAVAKLDHFFRYVQLIFGKPSGATLAKMIVNSKQDVKKFSEEIKNLKNVISNQKQLSSKDLYLTANKLESRIRDLQKEMMELQRSVRLIVEEDNKLAINLYYVLLAAVFGVIGMAVKTFAIKQKEGFSKLVD